MPGERAAELVARTDRELWEELMEVAFDGKQADGRPLADLGADLRVSVGPALAGRRVAAVPRVGMRARRVGQWRSWRVPERMAERVLQP